MSTTALIVMVVMMLMLMVMSAATLIVMVMVMLMLMVMSTTAFPVMIVMVMLMIVVILLIMVVMMVLMIVVMSTTALVIMVMMVLMLLFQQLICQRYRMLHNLQDLLSVQLLNRSCDNRSFLINRTKQLHGLHCFLLIYNIGTAHNDGPCILYLIIKELAEVSHIHFAFLRIHNCGVAVQLNVNILFHTLYSLDNIRKLANT